MRQGLPFSINWRKIDVRRRCLSEFRWAIDSFVSSDRCMYLLFLLMIKCSSLASISMNFHHYKYELCWHNTRIMTLWGEIPIFIPFSRWYVGVVHVEVSLIPYIVEKLPAVLLAVQFRPRFFAFKSPNTKNFLSTGVSLLISFLNCCRYLGLYAIVYVHCNRYILDVCMRIIFLLTPPSCSTMSLRYVDMWLFK